MKMSISKDKLVLQVVLALFLIAAGYAAMTHMKVGELESALQMASRTGEDAGTQLKGAQARLTAATARVAELEKKQKEAVNLKALLGSIEQQVLPVLEASARTAKPNVRANVLAGVGLIGQVSHGVDNEAALAALERALAADKTNCPAGLALNLSTTKKSELPAECQAFLPVPAAEAKPAAAAPAAAPAAAAPAAAPAAAAKADAKAAPAK